MGQTLIMTSLLRIAKSTGTVRRPPIAVEKRSAHLTLHHITFSVEATGPSPYPDAEFLAFCLSYCREHCIAAVVSENDLGSLIAAYLNEQLHLPGSSVESIFLALHKQLTKVKTHCAVSSELWNIWDTFPKAKLPCYLKAPYSSFGTLGFEAHTPADIERVLPQLHKKLPVLNAPIYEVLKHTSLATRYPEACIDAMTIEPLIHAPQVTVEGYVQAGHVTPLFITDTNFPMGDYTLFDNFSSPSRLPAPMQGALLAQTCSDIKTIGLDHTFFNVEYWIIEGKPVLIEINSRAAYTFRFLYKTAYDFDISKAIIDVALGSAAFTFHEANCTVCQANIFSTQMHTYAQLEELKELIPSTTIRIPSTMHKPAKSDHGTLAAQLELAGNSYEEIFSYVCEIRSALHNQHKLPPVPPGIWSIAKNRDYLF